MLELYFILGLALAIPEIILVRNFHWPRWLPPKAWGGRNMLKESIEKNPIYEIFFSLALGAFMAACMGIAGVTFAAANVFSTMITIAFYRWHIAERWIKFHAWCKKTRLAVLRGRDGIIDTYRQMHDFIVLVKDMAFMVWRWIFWPLRMLNKFAAWINKHRAPTRINPVPPA